MIFLILAFLFILVEGFFSGIETGFVSLRRSRVKHAADKKDKSAMILEYYLKNPKLMLTTTLLGANISLVLASLCSKEATLHFGLEGGMALLAMTVIMTILLLIVEIVPKDWFRQLPYERCAKFAKLFQILAFLLLPIAIVLTFFTEKINNIFIKSKTTQTKSKRNDLIHLLEESVTANIIDKQQSEILEKSLTVYSSQVKDIMIPKSKVKTIDFNSTITEAMDICREFNHSRLPIQNRNKWIGFFSIYDATLSVPEKEWNSSKVTICMRPLRSIDANVNTNVILDLTNKFRTPILTVIDNITKEDIGIISKMDIVKLLF